ncbi:MAG: hypothetical protein KC418_22095 [Anaerolineales bacterium]|nr:hypothetical protein [Anaerolineales bacterium]MCB8951169.1 hypothetical protein [Ardenticatenales bacterium]
MTIFLLILRFVIVVFFFIMFLRRPNVAWGVGLLTVTTAILLDAFVTIFGGAEAISSPGFFRSVLQGALFGGAAVWLWGVLRPLTGPAGTSAMPAKTITATTPATDGQPPHAAAARLRSQPDTAFDRQQMYEQIRYRFGREDVLDLIFDLGLNENDLIGLEGDMNQTIVRLIDRAEADGLTGALTLAVERILTPPAPQSLPRLEKLSADSPPTILRQYLLAHYDLAQLAEMAGALAVDWEMLNAGSKQTKVRTLLLYLYRRNRVNDLIQLLQMPAAATATTES